jgi:hypothetical protein
MTNEKQTNNENEEPVKLDMDFTVQEHATDEYGLHSQDYYILDIDSGYGCVRVKKDFSKEGLVELIEEACSELTQLFGSKKIVAKLSTFQNKSLFSDITPILDLETYQKLLETLKIGYSGEIIFNVNPMVKKIDYGKIEYVLRSKMNGD